jgi:hypothetical protein
MALSAPVPRLHTHTRSIEFNGYLRGDGLWDIEAELVDTRQHVYRTREGVEVPPPSRFHNMLLRVTLDDQMVIHALEAAMPATPFPECGNAADPMQRLVGARLGGGWRKAIDEAIGGIKGCTHMRELLFNIATAAFQTIPVYRRRMSRAEPEVMQPMGRAAKPPPHLGKCLSWDFNGPVVQRVAPEFFGWTEPPAG